MGQVMTPRKDLRDPTVRRTKAGDFWDFGGVDLGDRVVLVERFQRLPQVNASVASTYANKDFEILGTNASDDDVTYASGGGVILETDAVSTSSVIALPHLTTSQSAWTGITWDTSKQTRWECGITTGAAITTCVVWAGLKLTNTDVVATDADQVLFRYSSAVNSGTWGAVYSIANTDVTADTGLTVAVSTSYRLAIDIDSARVPRFYINGTLYKVGTALTASIALIPYVGVLTPTGSASARNIKLRYEAISRTFA